MKSFNLDIILILQNAISSKATHSSFLSLLISCDNDDDAVQLSPEQQLPLATQIGADTFGCLINGEAFVPGGGNNAFDAVYQEVDGEMYFGIQGNNADENFIRTTVSLGTNALAIEQGETYQLLESGFLSRKANGGYSRGSYFVKTSESCTGEMTITKQLDRNAQIVSGTFYFDVPDRDGNIIEIREGRFDMRYTF